MTIKDNNYGTDVTELPRGQGMACNAIEWLACRMGRYWCEARFARAPILCKECEGLFTSLAATSATIAKDPDVTWRGVST